jgi:hypothetical protein
MNPTRKANFVNFFVEPFLGISRERRLYCANAEAMRRLTRPKKSLHFLFHNPVTNLHIHLSVDIMEHADPTLELTKT